MEFSRKLGMLLVNNRSFAIAGMAMIEAAQDVCIFRTNTGMAFSLTPAELEILKQEIAGFMRGMINVSSAKYQSIFDCLRAFRWLVLPWRAINPAALSVIELINANGPSPHYKITLLGNYQFDLTPEESAHFQSECVNLIWEAQRIAQNMK